MEIGTSSYPWSPLQWTVDVYVVSNSERWEGEWQSDKEFSDNTM